MIENNILGVVLAGGKSKRFGSDKASIKLGNQTLIEHTISKIENNSQSKLSCMYLARQKCTIEASCQNSNLGFMIQRIFQLK